MAEKASAIQTVLILGDNRLSLSILRALKNTPYTLHQAGQSSTPSSTSNINYHTTNLDCDSLAEILKSTNPDVVINTTTSSTASQISLLDTCLAHKVPRIIPNEFSHDSLNPEICSRLPTSATKAAIIFRLRQRQQQQPSPSTSYVALATGYALDHALQTGSLGIDLKWQSATLLTDDTIPSSSPNKSRGEERFAVSSEDFRGRAVKAALERWPDVANRYLYVCGTVTCAKEILACLEDGETKREWEVGWNSVQDAIGEAERRIERGFPDAGRVLMERSVLFDGSVDGARRFVEEDDRVLLGLEGGESVREMVEKARHAAKHHGDQGCDCSS